MGLWKLNKEIRTINIVVTIGKVFTMLKTMSFTAADDTGVYTLPTGTKTLVATDGSITGQSGGSDLATNGAIKYAVPTTDGHCTGNKTSDFNCGYTSSAVGDLVYLDSSSTWQKAHKGTSVATYGGFLGIALEVKSSGQTMLVALPNSFIYATAFPTLTIGSPVYMGDTGAVVVAQPTTTDHAVRVIGYGVHADKLYFNPSSDYIIYTV
jgi:hypothetical protein